MKRRDLLMAGAAAGLAGTAAGAGSKRSILELTYYRTRNSIKNESKVTTDFLGNGLMPALKRAGLGRMGFFGSMVGPDSPYLLSVVSYPSLGAVEETLAKLVADKEYQSALGAYSDSTAQSYVRIESSLLRSFQSVPDIEQPAGSHIFELRTYESNTAKSLTTKIRMFDEGEVDIFRKYGLIPVFFGETITGRNMPNLTYMVAFQNMADREAAWGKFGGSPEWASISKKPGYADGEIVSNITNQILRPLPFSPLR